MSYHTVIVAFVVQAGNFEQAQEQLMDHILPTEEGDARTWERAGLDQWWMAEDERYDGSGVGGPDSAVFVPKGMSQREARRLLVLAENYGGEHE